MFVNILKSWLKSITGFICLIILKYFILYCWMYSYNTLFPWSIYSRYLIYKINNICPFVTILSWHLQDCFSCWSICQNFHLLWLNNILFVYVLHFLYLFSFLWTFGCANISVPLYFQFFCIFTQKWDCWITW